MSDLRKLVESISKVAKQWLDPEYKPRVKAEQLLYSTEARATPEAVAFAINQQMPQLSVSVLSQVTGAIWGNAPKRIGVLDKESVPLGGLAEWLLVLLYGYEYVGIYNVCPDFLLQGFAEDVKAIFPDLRSSFTSAQAGMGDFSAILALGIQEETLDVALDRKTIDEAVPRLYRPVQFSVAVIDGRETRDEIEDLAEDVLMHEGRGEDNVRIIWAPEELNPDPYFESFAFFRGVYPAHDKTPGSLQMKKAFLAAQDVPHAYGEGLEFLVSRGEAASLEPCHIRWVTYSSLSEVYEWVEINSEVIRSLVVRVKKHNQINTAAPLLALGKAHRLTLNENADTTRILSFLATI